MRLLVISDIHGAVIKYDELVQQSSPDVILLPGDIPSSIDFPSLIISLLHRGRRNAYIRNFYERFANRAILKQIRSTKLILTQLLKYNLPIVLIHGNTETPQTRAWLRLFAMRNSNLHYIADGFAKIQDVLFLGHGWVPRDPLNVRTMTPGELDEEYLKTILLDMYGRAHQTVDKKILVTHSPPYGTQIDYLAHRKYHAGSKPLRVLLDSQNIDGLISGHLHEAWGIYRNNRWWAVNAGAAVEDRACLIDLETMKLQWYTQIIKRRNLESMIYQRRRQAGYDTDL
ncbi:MAG: metallophosphoesterase family protein [Candidatus Kariarchaeaceae archaeon]|jgi:Icc-related predicted phosphoesterase